MIGNKIDGRYKLIEQIGDGGMAIVYKAEDLILERIVAVKLLRMEYSSDEQFIKRFQREIEAITSLSHPNIVDVYDFGTEKNLYYIVMEYIEGMTLKEIIKTRGAMPIEDALSIYKQIIHAINHAHENYIIHRDIKPQNILVNKMGVVKVTDFGIALAQTSSTITHTNSILGSVHYISPEQARGGIATVKSDIYSLGIILYEMLTGTLPFKGESSVAVIMAHLDGEFTHPKTLNYLIPQSIENVVLKAMAKDPYNRYIHVLDIEEDIETVLLPQRAEETKIFFDNKQAETKILKPLNITSDNIEYKGNEKDNSNEEKKNPTRTKGLLKKLLLVLILLTGGSLAAITVLPDLLKTNEVDVPNVVGKDYSSALEILLAKGLKVQKREAYNEDVSEDIVISQDPENSKVKENSMITLLVSKGEKGIELNNYLGQTINQIEPNINDLGFKEIIKLEEFSSQEEGTIINQSPSAGEVISPKNTILILTISKGEEILKLENLKGWTKEEVLEYAKNLGIYVKFNLEQYSNQYSTGQVIMQQPSPFENIRKGDEIIITLSKGSTPSEDEANNDEDTDVNKGKKDKEKDKEKENVTIEEEIMVEVPSDEDEDRKQYEVVIIFNDGRKKDGKITDRIQQSKEYKLPLTIEPGGEASYTVYLDDKIIKEEVIYYDDVKNE